MFQVFRSIQGIQQDSFTICLFLLQDITLQAGFHSISRLSFVFACNGATFSALFKKQQFPPVAWVHKHVKKLRYVSAQVTFGPERLQGAFVKGRLIFRLGGQVSHGLSSRWLEWGHDVVMGGGQQACACVCVETSEQLLCGRWNTSEAKLQLFFFLSSRCRFTLLRPSAVESFKWQPADWFAYPWKRWTHNEPQEREG